MIIAIIVFHQYGMLRRKQGRLGAMCW